MSMFAHVKPYFYGICDHSIRYRSPTQLLREGSGCVSQ